MSKQRSGRVPPIAKEVVDTVLRVGREAVVEEEEPLTRTQGFLKDIRLLLLLVVLVIPASLFLVAFGEWFWLYFILPEIMFGE